MTDLPANVRWQLWIVAFGFFMQSLDTTIVNTALPSMAKSLGESPLHMHMVIVSYVLTVAVMLPASGWLADKVGVRNIFFTAIVLFTTGSLFCAQANTLDQLIMARVLQGVGGAMMVPVGRLTVMKIVPREQYMAAMTFVTLPGQVGPLMGPALGGMLVEYASWHWIFLINLPVAAVGLWTTLRFMPDFRGSDLTRFDLSGYVMLVVAMLAISIALDGVGSLGLQHAVVVALLMMGLAALAAYWLHALRTPAPLFPPSLFKIQTFRVGLLGNLFARIGSGAMPYMIPLLMQLAMGYSPSHAGMLMLPMALAGMGMKRVVTRIVVRLGYRRVLVFNTLALGLMIASFALMTPSQPLWLRILQLAAFGAVNSMQFTAMNTVTLKDLGPGHASSGNSLMSMVQMLGMSLGVSVAAALLSTFSGWFGAVDAGPQAVSVFRGALVTIGVLTMASAAIFWQLADDSHRVPERADTADPGQAS